MRRVAYCLSTIAQLVNNSQQDRNICFNTIAQLVNNSREDQNILFRSNPFIGEKDVEIYSLPFGIYSVFAHWSVYILDH